MRISKEEYTFIINDYRKFVRAVNEIQGAFVYAGNNFARRDLRFNVYFDGTSIRVILNVPGSYIKAVNQIERGYKLSCTD